MAKQNPEPENYTPQLIKIITNHYDEALQWIEKKGKENYGQHFKIFDHDKLLVCRLICYFLNDKSCTDVLKINLDKGILLSGPVGCGKTSLMTIMRFFQPQQNHYILKPCRDISFEFIKDGYDTIHKYSRNSIRQSESLTYCFDDLGVENNLKYFGNECNVMAEILLTRYDLFVTSKLKTHLTTNLSATEIETAYGNRVRSRMRELFNLIAFDRDSNDKRK